MSFSPEVSAYIVRFLVSESEYPKLRKKLGQLAAKLPSHHQVKTSASQGDFVHELVRTQSRLFGKTYVIFFIVNLLIKRRGGKSVSSVKAGLSIASISGIYKALYFTLGKVAARIDNESCGVDVKYVSSSTTMKFRRKCKTIAKIAVPAISGVVAGSAYELFPNIAKGYIALYAASWAVEYLYNYLDDEGYLEFKPRILGSWALFPFAFSQLFYTFIMHPDCCPPLFSRLMLRMSDGYIPLAPAGFPAGEAGNWPSSRETIDSLAQISLLKYPKFVSPLMFPEISTLPAELASIEPVIGLAHPSMKTLTGALMHPTEPSEFRTYTEFILSNSGAVSKYVFALYAAISLLGRKKTNFPLIAVLGSVLAKTIRTTIFIVMTTASAWLGIGLSQQLLSNRLMPVFRYRIIGFLAGLWAFVDQVNGQFRFTYATRMAIMSYWRMLVKQRRIKPIPHGEVALFAAAFAAVMTIFDIAPHSIPGNRRKLFNWIKNHRYVDPVVGSEKEEEEKNAEIQ